MGPTHASVTMLVRISRLYYEAGRTQDAIARSLRLSRPTVSRALELGVTFGTYTFTGKENPAKAIAAADEAMYARKRSAAGADS